MRRRKYRRRDAVSRRSPSFEILEDRRLLSGSQTFAVLNGSIVAAGSSQQFHISVRPQDFNLPIQGGLLKLSVQPTSGSQFNPVPAQLSHSLGAAIPASFIWIRDGFRLPGSS